MHISASSFARSSRRHAAQTRPSLRVAAAALACSIAALAAPANGHAATATTTTAKQTTTTAKQAARPTASISVGSAYVGPKIPAGFVGLATEYWDLEKLAGNNPAAPDQPFEQVLSNLSPSGSLSLRIGGDSTDWSWWPLAGIKKPAWVRWSLSPSWAAVAKRVASDIHAKLILGINLEGENRVISEHEVNELKSHIGLSLIKAFEVGNEPELYPKYPFYYDGKQPVHGRPKSYQGEQIIADWDSMANGLMSGVPLAGPGFVSFNALDDEQPLLQSSKRLSLLTVHSYALKSTRCDGNVPLQESQLFEPSSLQGLAAQAQTWTRTAAHYGVPLRVDEMNSVTCGGMPNYSDSLGPALWALNILPLYAQAGVTGVNFDTVPGSLQNLIQATHTSAGWNVIVQPEYYGLLAFAQLTPAGSQLLSVSTAPDGMLVWAVRTPSKQTHIVVTNASNTKQVIAIKAAGASGAGTVTRLDAPHGLASTQGVTLGGQMISSGTGKLTGTAVNTIVDNTGGHYVVTVPGGSAAILTVS